MGGVGGRAVQQRALMTWEGKECAQHVEHPSPNESANALESLLKAYLFSSPGSGLAPSTKQTLPLSKGKTRLADKGTFVFPTEEFCGGTQQRCDCGGQMLLAPPALTNGRVCVLKQQLIIRE